MGVPTAITAFPAARHWMDGHVKHVYVRGEKI